MLIVTKETEMTISFLAPYLTFLPMLDYDGEKEASHVSYRLLRL